MSALSETRVDSKEAALEESSMPLKDTPANGSLETVIDPVLEKAYVRKLDLNILPMVMFIQLVSFLDRSNIGNAKIYGLTEDLKLTGVKFNVAASIFYVTYIAFEMPYNILQQRLGASRVIPIIVIAWSFVTLFSGFMHNYAGLLATRVLLGACEAGLFPGLNFYLSTLYTREEYAKRVCMLFVATALSGAFGGLIAYGVLQMDGVSGVAGWRWLFYIEGIISFVVGVFALFYLPSNPQAARFLNAQDKHISVLRQARKNEEPVGPGVQWTEVREALRTPMCWLSGVIQFGGDVCLYGFSTFLPTIIRGMGYEALKVQYLTIPIYLFGALTYILTVLTMDWIHFNKRSPFMVGFGLLSAVGYIILIASKTAGVKYFACFLTAPGIYILTGLNITWIGGNVKGRYKRAVAIAINQTLGNSGGVVAGQIYIAAEAPRYITGQAVSLAGISMAVTLTLGMALLLRTHNARKEKLLADGVTEDEDANLRDKSIHFKYML